MGLVHEFLLIKESEFKEREHDFTSLFDYKRANSEDVITLNDDLFGYFGDSLKWIPTFDPIKNKMMMGFNYYGISIMNKESMTKFITVMTSWRELFQAAPENINLQGPFFWIDEPASGQYKQLEYDKDVLINNLEELILIGQKVKDQDYVIVYFGI